MSRIANEKYEVVPIDRVTNYPDNPRQGDIGAIYESIEENNFFGALIVQLTTGYVLAGNHRYHAAVRAGLTEIPVIWVDVEDDKARRIALADNKTNDLAGWDEALLFEQLKRVHEDDPLLLGTGYSPDDLDEIAERVESADPEDLPNTFGVLDVYESRPVRQIMFILSVPEFDWTLERLRRVMDEEHLYSNTEAALLLLAEHFAEPPPPSVVRHDGGA